MKRMHVYLDDGQIRLLAKLVRASGRSRSAIAREALDHFLEMQPSEGDLRAALRETFGAMPGMKTPDRSEWDRDVDGIAT